MDAPGRYSWFGTAIVIGVLYCVIGIVFALPSNQVRMWRLAAWVASAALYAAHIAYERFRLRNSSRSTALHVALAVAIGGFGLAVAAIIHSLFVPPNYTRWRFVLALVAWPIITALPAFIVALAIAWVLARLPSKRLAE
jgi:uncharacterized membrane protein YbhN (UPF0104 family)